MTAAYATGFDLALGTVSRDAAVFFPRAMQPNPLNGNVVEAFGVAGAGHANHTRSSPRYAWPSGEWGSLPIEGGVEAAYKRQIQAAEDPVYVHPALEQGRGHAMRDGRRVLVLELARVRHEAHVQGLGDR